MRKPAKMEYGQLVVGDEFPPASYRLDSKAVATYLKAVGETSPLYQGTELVPPTAVAAYALKVLTDRICLPSGAVHVAQELEFLGTVSTGDTLTCHARVTRKHNRGKIHLLTVSFSVLNQGQAEILCGRTSFVLPEDSQDSGAPG